MLFLSFTQKPALASNIKINEFVAHPSSGNKEWVEFYNPDKVDLTKYWLDDDMDFSSDTGSSAKKSLTALQQVDSVYPYLEFDSFLNNGGDYVVLFTDSGNIIDQFQYTSDPGADISIGRSPDGNDDFVILAQQSKGTSNGHPAPSPSPSPSPSPTPQNSPSPTPSANQTLIPTPSPSQLIIQSLSPSPDGAILGQATESAPQSPFDYSPQPDISTETEEPKSQLGDLLVSSGMILSGFSLGGYLWYKGKPK